MKQCKCGKRFVSDAFDKRKDDREIHYQRLQGGVFMVSGVKEGEAYKCSFCIDKDKESK